MENQIKSAVALLVAGLSFQAGTASAADGPQDMFTATSTVTIVSDPAHTIFNMPGRWTPFVTAANPTLSVVSTSGWSGKLVSFSGGAVGATPMTATLSPVSTASGQPTERVGFVNNTTSKLITVLEADGLAVPTTASPASGLSYAGFGMWNMRNTAVNTAATAIVGGAYAGGTPTTTAQMPRTGTATYTGKMTGTTLTASNTQFNLLGNARLTASFATHAVTGTMTGIKTYNGRTAAAAGTFNSLTISAGVISANAFTATIKAGAPGTNRAASINQNTSGTLNAHFYGTAADEVAGVFRLVSGSRQVLGSFGAKQ